MSKKPRPPSLNALKHGGYSNLGLLPGEDPDEYNEHHRQNRLEWRPAGLSEEAIVTHMGDLLWREKNLAVYQLFALLAKKWELVLAGANEPGFSLDDGLLRILKRNGFTHVFNLLGGIKAWEALNLPLDQPDQRDEPDNGNKN